MHKIAVIGVKGLPAFGGSARACENLIKLLKHKYEFVIYALASHTDMNRSFSGYSQIILSKLRNKKLNTLFYWIKATIHCLWKGNYDLIHVYHYDAAFVIPLLRLKYRVIASNRGRPQEYGKWNRLDKLFFSLMETIFYKCPADIITSVSKRIAVEAEKKTKRKIHYIPNGIILSENIITKDIPERDYIFFSAARIISTKGCHILLEALLKIQYIGKVKIAGSLNHSPKYSEVLKKLGSQLNTCFLGLIKDKNLLLAYIRNSKFAVYPSSAEGMSNMLLEIASMKTPIICSDIPDNLAVFDKNEALFFKTNNVADLSKKIIWALSNPEQMRNKAENAYNKLAKDFNWENIAKIYDSLYQTLIKK